MLAQEFVCINPVLDPVGPLQRVTVTIKRGRMERVACSSGVMGSSLPESWAITIECSRGNARPSVKQTMSKSIYLSVEKEGLHLFHAIVLFHFVL